jgi:hypothetical protein
VDRPAARGVAWTMEVLMSGTTTPVLAPVTRALGAASKKRRSDQSWEVTEADLNMYGFIVGRTPSDAEKVQAIQRARQLAAEREIREAEAAARKAQGPAWSPTVLCSYLRGLCNGAVELRVGGPQFSGWIRQLSMQARQRLQETQTRLANARTR